MRTQQRKGLCHPPPSFLSSPLYQRILQFQALSSLRQQGTDVRKFAPKFSGVAEGLGYNEHFNWWRMRGLDHLRFGGFVEFLAHSPCKVGCSAPSGGRRSCSAPSGDRWSFRAPSGGQWSCSIPLSETEEGQKEGFFHPSRLGGCYNKLSSDELYLSHTQLYRV